MSVECGSVNKMAQIILLLIQLLLLFCCVTTARRQTPLISDDNVKRPGRIAGNYICMYIYVRLTPVYGLLGQMVNAKWVWVPNAVF
jgi:hypothetical protein